MTAHRKLQSVHSSNIYRNTEEEEDVQADWRSLTCGRAHARHFIVFFNVPVQAPTRGQLFLGYSEKPSHFRRLFTTRWGYRGSFSHFKPRVPTGILHFKIKFWNHLFISKTHIFKILYFVLHVQNWFVFKNIVLHLDMWCILLVFYYM